MRQPCHSPLVIACPFCNTSPMLNLIWLALVLTAVLTAVLVRCEADPPANSDMAPGLISARSGAGDIRAAAEWAIRLRDRRVLEEYGPVLEWSGTGLRTARNVPWTRAEGSVFLAGTAPLPQKGNPVRIIATGTGQTCEGAAVHAINFPPPVPTPTPDPAMAAHRAAEQRQRENAEILSRYGATPAAR